MVGNNPYKTFYDTQVINTLKRIRKELKPTHSKELLLYYKHLTETVKARPARILTLLQKIFMIYKYLDKPLSKANRGDAHKLVNYLNKQQWKERTKGDYKAIYKQYRKWLTGDEDFPEDVRWIKGKQLLDTREIQERTPSDLMRIEDFKRFLNACTTPRDRAMFGMIGELGLRPKEALMLQLRNIDTTNKEYVLITVPSDTKTGSRPVPLIYSKKWVLEWKLKYHPDKENEQAFAFVQETRNRHLPISYKGLADRFTRMHKKSGIKKKLTLYDFRRFSYTFKAQKGWGDQQIKAFHGLRPKSKAIDVYVHIDAKDLLDPVKELYGIKVIKQKDKEMEVICCPTCDTEQPSTNKQCETCGLILDVSLANKQIEEGKKKDKQLEDLNKQVQLLRNQQEKFMADLLNKIASKKKS